MKTKNILGLVAMAFNITVSNKKTDAPSLLAMKYVEALAGGEKGEDPEAGYSTHYITRKCSEEGEEMWGGLGIWCLPGGPDETCEQFDPCNF